MRGIKITFGLLFVFAITAIVVIVLSIRLAQDSLPQTDGTIKLYGLRSSCKIYRDDFGVPHIIARNEEDLFFALGFVHAQDRLWQMEFNRRVATGNLSEIFGERTIRSDKFYRTIGLHQIAEKIATNLSPESRNLLFHYIAGINNYIKKNYDNLPIEFAQLKYKPEPWNIQDIIALQRLVAWEYSTSRYYDLFIGSLAAKCGYSKINELYPGYLKTHSSYQMNQLKAAQSVISDVTDFIFKVPQYGFAFFANQSLCVSGEKTAGGKPICAFAPVQKPTLPSNWYEVHLVAPFIDSYGLTTPGLPALLTAFNDNLIWNLMPLNSDDLDFYIEQVDSVRYFYKNAWNPIETRTEVIRIKDSEPVELKVRNTVHGPLISDLLNKSYANGFAISVKWLGQELTDDFSGYYHLLKSRNVTELLDATRFVMVPAYKILYADTLNNLGLRGTGLLLNRKIGQAAVPLPGWNSRFDWPEFMTQDIWDRTATADAKYLFTENESIDDLQLTSYLKPECRFNQVKDTVTVADTVTISMIKNIQNEIYSWQAKSLLPRFVKVLESVPVQSDLQKFFVDKLQQWDYSMDERQIAPTIYNMCLVKFVEQIFKDDMGDSLFSLFTEIPEATTAALINVDGTSWIDDVRTPEKESLDTIILRSLDAAYQTLVQKYGDTVDNWRWGNVHQIYYVHELGKDYPDNWVFNIESVAINGGNCTIDNSAYEVKRLFNVAAISTCRGIVDLSDIENSQMIISLGQSGQPMDEHYKDQFTQWRNGQYRNISFNQEAIQHSGYNLLVLKPN